MNKFEKVALFASAESWIEGESLRQLERVAAFPGMLRVAGFPDLHPGKGSPVGAAMLSQGEFYPYLIGSDVGCGMGLFATEISVAKARPEKWFKKLKGLESPWDGDSADWLAQRGASPEGYLSALGTIGRGNHFAEMLRIDKIHNADAFKSLKVDEKKIFLLVHSGSRDLGNALLRDHTDRFQDKGLKEGSDEAIMYLRKHDNALAWARANRELIACRLLEQLNSGYKMVSDLFHNSISMITANGSKRYLHRKGAAPSDCGVAVTSGSRGTCSYLVMPVGEHEPHLWSIAHGAGRKWNRSACKDRLKTRYAAEALQRTKRGGYVICDDKDLLYEEAPEAYKNIERIIEDMQSFGFIRVVASFSSLLTYKVRE
ncbi:MAG: RNA ligase RtcB family protein [Desulfobacteraceae bacterium]|nr:MAG: RNA ligase RtcB family protein [Desulfobacteraceae bacterium]